MVAAALAGGAAGRPDADPGGEVAVLVAREPLAPGASVAEARRRRALVVASWPRRFAAGAVGADAPATRALRLRAPLPAGAVVTEAATVEPALAVAALAPGERAVALPADAVEGLADALRPGTRVDVVVTAPRADGAVESRYLVEDVQVLSAGAPVDPAADRRAWTPDERPAVTVRATAEQALALAGARGGPNTLRVVLRGDGSGG
jgi:Flp pilus assembly protein CpaB